jgi:hypothetical protein
MVGKTTGAAIQPISHPRRMSPFARVAIVLVVVLTGWLVIGFLRAEAVARDYFAHAAGARSTIVDVQVLTVAPAIPPFGAVNITGQVIEGGGTGPGYTSAMWLWVEPVTGWVLVFGQG